MKIEKATDWQQVHCLLLNDLHSVGFNPDLSRLLTNISVMVVSLSKAEVECRRMHNFKNLAEPLEKVNTAIKHLEQLLLMAKLMK